MVTEALAPSLNTKVCTRCRATKPLEDFKKAAFAKHSAHCKECIKIYAGKHEAKVCRFPKCFKGAPLRRGLCTKHIKWLYKGHMDEDLNILKKVREVRHEHGTGVCAIPFCKDPTKKGAYCIKHYAQLQRKSINKKGEPLNLRIKYPPDFKCIVNNCKVIKRNGKIVKGFCLPHYNQFITGFIDSNGVTTFKEKERVVRYTKDDRCMEQTCFARAKSRGFCRRHFDQFQSGSIGNHGERLTRVQSVNKGKICSIEGCEEKSYCRTFCLTHYTKGKTRGHDPTQQYPSSWINKGRTCLAENCKLPATSHQRCRNHSDRFVKGLPEQSTHHKNVGACLVEGCEREAKTKSRCRAHYDRFRKGKSEQWGPTLYPKDYDRVCKIDDCTNKVSARYLCDKHSRQAKARGGDMSLKYPLSWVNFGKECKVLGCKKPARSRQRCSMHYARWRLREKAKLNENNELSC